MLKASESESMAQRTTGLYRAITIPSIYKGLQFALGADNFLRRYATEVLRIERGMTVLDVGCGPANILVYLPEIDYTGVDLNEKHIAFARERHGHRGRFFVADAAVGLAGDGRTFDVIKMTGVLHHLSDDECRALIASVAPLLKPSGRLVTLDTVWLPRQRLIPILMNTADSGKNVRAPDGYLALLSGLPLRVESRIFHDLLRIPYDHFVMTARHDANSLV
jgi:SAM-dependent methyltransferase